MIQSSEIGPQPNVYLVGAPRSGASAMVEYLRDHPYAFFPANPKPQYWASDYPGLSKRTGVSDERDYMALYANCSARHQVIGDGSTMYLASEDAIERILEFNPDAKFVVILRDPSEMVVSFFCHLRRMGDEDQSEFENAWAMQNDRLRRSAVPKGCREKKLLQYAELGMTGRHLQRAMQHITKEQLLVLFFEDFQNKPREAYRKTIAFLDLPDDDRREFPLIATKKSHSPIIRGVMKAPMARRFYSGLKNKLSGRIATAVRDSVLARSSEEVFIRPIFKNKLIDEFAADVRLLSSLTGRNLDHWLRRAAL